MSEDLSVSPQSILYEKGRKLIIDSELYKDPKKLFDWAEKITQKTIKIENWINGNQTAFELVKIIRVLPDSENIFENIIKYGKSVGVESQVQASDIGYQATVVISMYLDRVGLGYTDNPPKLLKV